MQAMTNMRKRMKGEPTSGMISIVNTDIEGYSGEDALDGQVGL